MIDIRLASITNPKDRIQDLLDRMAAVRALRPIRHEDLAELRALLNAELLAVGVRVKLTRRGRKAA